ncbi:MAG: bacteriorhodopsin-like [Myxococcota bacterium]|nr:bacteriorhodopsin-like [Myxococcota bacterium]
MDLSPFQFGLISNLMSLTVAGMGAATLFFFLSRSQVAPAYRPALLISGLVVAIACYHYFRIYQSFTGAYVLQDGLYVPSGTAFNDAYRYADWLLTVPLLIIELVAVLNLAKPLARSLMLRLGGAALLMIALGYPGEVATSVGGAVVWWILAMVPFLYIVRALYTEFSQTIEHQPQTVRPLVDKARLLVVASWAFYPVAYLGGLGASAGGETLLQVGYTVADLVAKVGLGLFIYAIARAKSEVDGYTVGEAPVRLAPAGGDVRNAANG